MPTVHFQVFRGMDIVWMGEFKDMKNMPHDDNTLMYLVFIDGQASRLCTLSQLTTVLALTWLCALDHAPLN